MTWLAGIYRHCSDALESVFSTEPVLSGGDGSSRENAVIIAAKKTQPGVRAEYRYVSSVCGVRDVDWRLTMQAICPHAGRWYDVLTIETRNKESREFWFDMTSFYGRH